MDTYTAPARFFTLPDGTPSSVQMVVGSDGQPRPLEVKTPQQMAHWNAIQDARPLSSVEQQTRLNVSLAHPIANAASETDTLGAGRDWITERRFQAEAEAATAPQGPRDEAGVAALASALGMALVRVRADLAWKVPAHLELRDAAGNTVMAGDLGSIGAALSAMARERDRRDAAIAAWEAHQKRIRAEAAERSANTAEARIARLEAALAAQGIDPAPLTVVHGSLPGA